MPAHNKRCLFRSLFTGVYTFRSNTREEKEEEDGTDARARDTAGRVFSAERALSCVPFWCALFFGRGSLFSESLMWLEKLFYLSIYLFFFSFFFFNIWSELRIVIIGSVIYKSYDS